MRWKFVFPGPKMIWVSLDAPDWGDSRSENPKCVHILIRPQNAKYFLIADDEKFNVAQIGNVIYQMNQIFKENPDLESVFWIGDLWHLLRPVTIYYQITQKGNFSNFISLKSIKITKISQKIYHQLLMVVSTIQCQTNSQKRKILIVLQ